MALNIKNPYVVRLVEEVARMCGETKTETIRRALEERKLRLSFEVVRRDRSSHVARFLEREIWSQIPPEVVGTTMTKTEEEEILGFGADGA